MTPEHAQSLADSLACPAHSWSFGDMMFSPPVTTNHWAIVQGNRAPVGLVCMTALPFLAGHQPKHPWYYTNITTGEAMLDGQLLVASLGTKECQSQWFPDRIERVSNDGQLLVHNTTFCPWGTPAVVQRIVLTNQSDAVRELTFGVSLRGCPGKMHAGDIGKLFSVWDAPMIQGPESGSLGFHLEDVALVEGLVDAAEMVEQIAQQRVTLEPGASRVLHYLAALDASFDCRSLVSAAGATSP